MRHTHLLATTFILLLAAEGTATAQTITSWDGSGPRVSLKASYGGHGSDWEGSIDSPLVAGFVRFRAGAGRGRWASPFDSRPPAAGDPFVNRLAGAVVVVLRPPSISPDVRAHIGFGVSRYFPRGVDMPAQTGTRLILGMEYVGERWAVGPEFEFDVPKRHDHQLPLVGRELLPAARIGLAVRRRF